MSTSFYEDASLVMIPSGYKTSKVYSAKPTDGAGDLSFTRSNDTATRVNSAGLIEKVRTNLVTYSEDFTNVAWLKTNASVTADATTAPDGTTTADKIVATAISANHFVTRASSVLNGEHTFSVFAKASEYSLLRIIDLFSNVYSTTFNLSNGTASGTGAAIQSVGSGWYRCSVTFTSSGSTVQNGFIGVPSSSINYAGDGVSGVFVWGAQFESGVMTDYIATTSAAVSVGPVANVPRLDYLNSSCPRLLLEPQRTNLAFYSEQFNDVYFSKVNAAINANALISPDGYTNADKFVATATTGVHYLGVPVSSASPAVLSVFAKAAEETVFAIGNATGSSGVVFNLSNGTITSGTGGTIENYGNGWYRCSYYRTSWTDFQYFSLRGNVPSYTGNGTDGIYIYGVQFEAGAYATSYIPTLGAAVTRGADAASKTGISSLIGQTEGTIYWEGNIKAVSELSRLIFLNDGTTNNFINTYVDSANKIAATVRVSGSTITSFESTVQTAGTFKVAFSYKANDCALYINGVSVSGTSGATVPATSRLDIGSRLGSDSFLNSGTSQALLFKTRLTNAQLLALTSL